jgi:3-dehydroquinate synthase
LNEFQEHLGGELCITMPLGIGNRHEVHQMEMAKLEEALVRLKEMADAD